MVAGIDWILSSQGRRTSLGTGSKALKRLAQFKTFVNNFLHIFDVEG
jgi:hypothetical protein